MTSTTVTTISVDKTLYLTPKDFATAIAQRLNNTQEKDVITGQPVWRGPTEFQEKAAQLLSELYESTVKELRKMSPTVPTNDK